MPSNQSRAAFQARREELQKLLRAALPVVARELLASVPPAKRSDAESSLLFDVARGRRDASSETLAGLLALQDRATSPHALSDAIRAVEVQLAPAADLLWEEVNLNEEEAEAALDRAQFLAGPVSPCPTAATRVWEAARQGIHALCRLRDLAAQHMHSPAPRKV